MAKLGNMKNKDLVRNVQVGNVAAAVKLTAGMAVYQDGANGFKVVPTSGQPPASQVRFVENEADNLTGVLGDKKVETYKSGAIMVVKAQGNIPVGSKLRCSATTAGSLSALADEPNTTTATDASTVDGTYGTEEATVLANLRTIIDELKANAIADSNVKKFHVANYLGHPGEGEQTGAEVTAATDGQEILVQIL